MSSSDFCGGSRIRTGDPMLAKHVLYQLSYTPLNTGGSAPSYSPAAPGLVCPPSSDTPSAVALQSERAKNADLWCGRRFGRPWQS